MMKSDKRPETKREYTLRSLRGRYINLRDTLHTTKREYYDSLVHAVIREECRIMIDEIFTELGQEDIKEALINME